MRRFSPRLAVAISLILLTLTACGGTRAPWTASVDLSAGGHNASEPQVALAPDGTATVVWSRFDGSNFIVQARRLAPDGTPEGVTRDLSAGGEDAFAPQVAVGADGAAAVVWSRFDGSNFIVQARRLAPDGTPEPAILDLCGPGEDAEAPHVALGPDGTATVVWQRFNGAETIVQARRVTADGSIGWVPRNLSAIGENATEPRVAVGLDGVARVVWDRWDGSNTIVQARRIRANGKPEALTRDLSAAGQNAVAPQIALDASGNATVAWARSNGSNEIVQARRLAPDGTPDPSTRDLSATGQDADEPQVALAPDGTATVVWDRFDGSNQIVQARRIDPGGTPDSSTMDISAPGHDAFGPQIGIDGDGVATVVWEGFNGSNQVVQARRIAGNGTPDPTTDDLSTSGGDAFVPEVAVGADETSVVWDRLDGSNDIIQGSTLPGHGGKTSAAPSNDARHSFAQAGGADAAMYWGATIHGETYGLTGTAPQNQQVWNLFESHAGKKVTMLNMLMPWGVFDTAAVQTLRNRGALPLVTMDLENATLADVAAGKQDTVIRAWAQKAKAWGYPFLFRPWWEMNGNWYAWGRDPNFIAAWRHFHDLVVAEGATNVTWAWIVNRLWSPASDPAPYYPGDAYVDWVGTDAYNWGRNRLEPNRWNWPDRVLSPTLNRLEQIAPGKPVCICEIASTEIGGNKSDWIRSLLSTYLPHHPEVKAFLWFNWNIPVAGGRWDWQIESSSPARLAFRRLIQSNLYRSTLPPITPLAKVPTP